jgi:predicted DNA-binding protein
MAKIISVSLDDEAEQKLNKIVKKLDRSVSDSVRKIIQEYELLDE